MGKEALKRDVLEIMRTRLEGIGQLLDGMSGADAEKMVEMILGADRTFVAGKGRSGLVAGAFAMRLMQLGLDVHVPDEVTCPRIGRGDLMIAISCSGTTGITNRLARISDEVGARVVAVTAVADSPITEVADHVVVVPATERKVKKSYRYVLGPYNNTLFEEAVLLYLDAMVYAILERAGIPKRTVRTRHTNLE
jgi:6-phospho-3-hexuloisomerase